MLVLVGEPAAHLCMISDVIIKDTKQQPHTLCLFGDETVLILI